MNKISIFKARKLQDKEVWEKIKHILEHSLKSKFVNYERDKMLILLNVIRTWSKLLESAGNISANSYLAINGKKDFICNANNKIIGCYFANGDDKMYCVDCDILCIDSIMNEGINSRLLDKQQF
jgi:hypothetical protein